jgi:DNA-binding response OmpR family regulator
MLNDFDVTLAKWYGRFENSRRTYDLCILDVMMPYKETAAR